MLNLRPNIFRKKFLRSLDEPPETTLLAEARTAGPWRVTPERKGDETRWILKAALHPETVGAMRFPQAACLLAALLPGSTRHPHYSLKPKGGKSALVMPWQGELCNVADLESADLDFVAHLNTAHYLLSSRESLAWLLMALPPVILSQAGDLAMERLRRLQAQL